MRALSRATAWLAVVAATACGSGGTEVGEMCGGFTGRGCGDGLWCDFGRNSCGIADEQGVCAARPDACTAVFQPVCGCDGQVYGNECEASMMGVDVNESGGCDAPAGMFACGFAYCEQDLSYCRVLGSDVPGEPNGFDCVALPAACGDPADCACLAGEACGDMCEQGADAGLTVICPGG